MKERGYIMKKIIAGVVSLVTLMCTISTVAFAKGSEAVLVVVKKENSQFGKQYLASDFQIDGIKDVTALNYYASQKDAEGALVNLEEYKLILKITFENSSEENLQAVCADLLKLEFVESAELDSVNNLTRKDAARSSIFLIIKEDSKENPIVIGLSNTGYDDITIMPYYMDESPRIYVFEYQCVNENYTTEVTVERIGNYNFMYMDAGRKLYVTYEEKIEGLKSAYETGKIDDTILDSVSKEEGIKAFKIGDINLDKTIDILDVVLARGFIVNGSFNEVILTEEQSDLNGDKKLDISDVVIMRNYIVNRV